MLSTLLLATTIPEPDVGSLAASLLSALSSKNYTLVASILLVGAVWAVRTFGTKAIPGLGTPRAGAILSVVGGTASLLVAALASGQAFSLGLLFGCVNAALAASGLWSAGKNLLTPPEAQRAPTICTPAEIANGTCKP